MSDVWFAASCLNVENVLFHIITLYTIIIYYIILLYTFDLFLVFSDIYHEIPFLYKTTNDCFFLYQKICLCNNKSFHMLWKLIQDMFKNISHNCKYFNICEKYLLFITLSGFHENATKFWEDEIKYAKQNRKSSNLKKSVLTEKWSNSNIVTSWSFTY